MENRIIPEQKEEISLKPPVIINPIKNIIKVTFEFYTDRNPMMEKFMKADKDVEFKIIDNWGFKMKTSLSLNEVNKILIQNRNPFKTRKLWFFL